MEFVKKNDVITLEIARFGSSGEGIAHLEDGKVVFVAGGLPGESCRVQIMKVGKTALWGRVQQVLVPSPHRIQSDCPYHAQCGGCQYRHVSYQGEQEAKRQKVEDAIQRIGGLSLSVPEILGAEDQCRYRNKVQFPVSEGNSGPKVGFYRARSHQVVNVEDCQLQPVQAAQAAQVLRDWMKAYSIPAYDEVRHKGLVRHLYLRFAREGILVCLVVNGKQLPHSQALVEQLCQAIPELVGVVLSINREKTNVILGGKLSTLWGKPWLEDQLCGLTFRISVPSFYQVNHAQTEVLYGKAVEFAQLTGKELVLDLYCGIGTISLAMAQQAGSVIGAEIVPEAVEDATANARRNGITNARFICGDASQAAARLVAEGLAPDVVCVDPPRKGLALDVIQAVVQMNPKRVVYVSCDPATLARDLARFEELGYGAEEAVAVDMFPRTAHVEAVILLSQYQSTEHINVYLDLDEIDLTKAEMKPTYAKIKGFVEERYGMKVSTLYIAQVKEKLGLEKRKNYNISKRGGTVVPQCPPEKEDAIIAALNHFGLITG